MKEPYFQDENTVPTPFSEAPVRWLQECAAGRCAIYMGGDDCEFYAPGFDEIYAARVLRERLSN